MDELCTVDVAALSKKFVIDRLRGVLIFVRECYTGKNDEEIEWMLFNDEFFEKHSSHPCCRGWKMQK